MRAWITSRRDQRASLFLFLIALLCYAYVFPRWSDPNQNSRLNMVIAVVDDGTFKINKYVSNTVDYAKVGENYYSDKAPGAAFLAMPFYAGLKWALSTPSLAPLTERLSSSAAFQSTLRADGSGVNADKVRFALAQVVLSFFTNAVPSALTVVLIFRLLGSVAMSAEPRAAVALSYGLLTPAFAYANAFYGHQLSAALLFAAFYILATRASADMPRWQSALAGFLLGYSVLSEFPAVIPAALIWLYALWRFARSGDAGLIVPLTLGAGLCAAALLAYNATLFGGPLTFGYHNSELWQQQHGTGLLSLTQPSIEALHGITVSPYRGLLLLSPVLVLALPGILLWLIAGIGRAELALVVAVSAAMLLFNASSGMWWGGFAIGPRYLLPALPFFVLPIMFLVTDEKPFFLRIVLALFMAASLVTLWGLTLADQAFPSDTIKNPLIEHALPSWTSGNLARNVGTLLGFSGAASLTPLAGVVLLLVLLWSLLGMRFKRVEMMR